MLSDDEKQAIEDAIIFIRNKMIREHDQHYETFIWSDVGCSLHKYIDTYCKDETTLIHKLQSILDDQ